MQIPLVLSSGTLNGLLDLAKPSPTPSSSSLVAVLQRLGDAVAGTAITASHQEYRRLLMLNFSLPADTRTSGEQLSVVRACVRACVKLDGSTRGCA